MNQVIEILRGAYAAFNSGDMDAVVASMDANIDWVEPLEFPGGGAYRGREAVKQYLTQSRAAWAEGSSQPEGFVIADNKIVVFVHARFRLTNEDGWREVRLADVYTIRDNQIVAMRAFADREEALRWAGAKEKCYEKAS